MFTPTRYLSVPGNSPGLDFPTDGNTTPLAAEHVVDAKAEREVNWSRWWPEAVDHLKSQSWKMIGEDIAEDQVQQKNQLSGQFDFAALCNAWNTSMAFALNRLGKHVHFYAVG